MSLIVSTSEDYSKVGDVVKFTCTLINRKAFYGEVYFYSKITYDKTYKKKRLSKGDVLVHNFKYYVTLEDVTKGRIENKLHVMMTGENGIVMTNFITRVVYKRGRATERKGSSLKVGDGKRRKLGNEDEHGLLHVPVPKRISDITLANNILKMTE